MDCIIKPAGIKEFTDKGGIPKDIKTARKLAKKGKLTLVKKKTFGVLVYSGVDYAACYAKHIQGTANDLSDYTVLKRVDKATITPDEFKHIFELAIQQIPRNKDWHYVALPSDYYIQVYNQDNPKKEKSKEKEDKFIIKQKAEFFFKDFLNLSSVNQITEYAKRYQLTGKVNGIKQEIEQYESEHPDEVLSYIFIIGHSDIR